MKNDTLLVDGREANNVRSYPKREAGYFLRVEHSDTLFSYKLVR